MTPGQQVNVSEVTPSGALRHTRDRGHDLFREYHGERVAAHSEVTAEQSRDLDRARRGLDGVADVHVDVELRPSGPQLGGHSHPHARVDLFVPDECGLRRRQVEGDTIVDVGACDLIDRRKHRLRIVVLTLGQEVEVSGDGLSCLGPLPDRQRLNVAASRAQDQLWCVRSVSLDELHPDDVRSRLIRYCQNPTWVDQATAEAEASFDSDFERDVFRNITGRGYRVRTQYRAPDAALSTLWERLESLGIRPSAVR